MVSKAVVYLARCMSDHVYEVIPGSALEKECKEREAAGFLDAIALPFVQCPNCLEDKRTQLNRDANSCGMVGCVRFNTYEECRKNGRCIFWVDLINLPESKYFSMLRGIPSYDVLEDPEFTKDMKRDQIDFKAERRRKQEEGARADADSAKKAAGARCSRCNHPAKDHTGASCGAPTKKGRACACPRLVA